MLNELGNIKKNFSIVAAAQVAYKVMLFVTFALIARKLGVSDFGKFSYAMAFAGLFTVLADLGMSSSIVKDTSGIDRHKAEGYLSDIISLKLFLSALTACFVFMAGVLFHEHKDTLNIIMLSLLFLILNSYTVSLRAIFRVFEKMKYDGLSVFIESILKISFVMLTLHFLEISLTSIVMVLLLANIVTLAITAWFVDKRFARIRFSLKPSHWPVIINSGLIFAFVGFFQLISFRIDIIMLSRMTTDAVTGIYSAATRIVEPLFMIPLIFTDVSFPALSRLYKESRPGLVRLRRDSIKLLFMSGILIAVILYSSSKVVIVKILGTSYLETINVLKLLCWLFIPFFIKFFLEGIALALDMRKRLYLGYAVSTVTKIIITAILIPVIGYKGAVAGTIISELIMIGFLWNLNI